MKTRIAAWLSIVTTVAQLTIVHAQGTAFTYQGRLNDGANPANGIYDLRFTIYDAATNGAALANSVTNSAVGVTNGMFTVPVDFGNVFTGGSNWLEIAVSTNGANNFTTLAPRQEVTPVPYSMFSANAGVATAVPAGTISAAMLANGAVTSNKIAPGTVSGLDAPDGSRLRALNVSNNGAVGIGTNSPQALLHVVSAGPVNTALDSASSIGTWLTLANRAGGTNWHFISTGTNNGEGAGKLLITPGPSLGVVSSFGSFVVDPRGRLGLGTISPGARLDVAGGSGTSIRVTGAGGNGATVALDLATYAPELFGTNTPSARLQATDRNFSADLDLLTKMVGSATNSLMSRLHVTSDTGFVGVGNPTPERLLHVGNRNVAGSEGMIRLGSRSTNDIAARAWDIGVPQTGEDLTGMGYSFVINDVDGGPGAPEFIIRWDSHSVGVGTANPQAALDVVSGNAFPHLRVGASSNAPYGSFLSLDASSISGGKEFFIFSSGGSAGEGNGKLVFQNHTDEQNVMAFGTNNYVGVGTVDPTVRLQVNGGIRARGGSPGAFGNANNGLTFSAPGDDDSGISSSANGQLEFYSNASEIMRIAASGNVGIGTVNPQQKLHVVGNIFATGTITPNSDRNAKTNVTAVDIGGILERVSKLPIRQWRFKTEAEQVKHVGPMAQDFYDSFGLGEQKTAIATVDADGVALAAIQALNEKMEARSRKLEAENSELQARLEKLERLLEQQLAK